MNGLIQSATPAPVTAQPTAQSQTPRLPITPSQEPIGKDFQMFVAKGLDLISNPQTRDSIVVLLKQGDPVSALANALVVVLQKLDMAARKKSTEVSDVVKLFGAHELITELAKIMEAAKIAELDEKHIELAFTVAIQDYIKNEVKAGRIDPAKLQAQTKASMAKLKPEQRKEVQDTLQRIQQTAKSYNGGKK